MLTAFLSACAALPKFSDAFSRKVWADVVVAGRGGSLECMPRLMRECDTGG